jgi:hypothetical protein
MPEMAKRDTVRCTVGQKKSGSPTRQHQLAVLDGQGQGNHPAENVRDPAGHLFLSGPSPTREPKASTMPAPVSSGRAWHSAVHKSFYGNDLKNVKNLFRRWSTVNWVRTMMQQLHYYAVFSCTHPSKCSKRDCWRTVGLILRIHSFKNLSFSKRGNTLRCDSQH